MCGIAGIVNFDQSLAVTKNSLQAMGDALYHRGPDGEGLYQDGAVGFIHRRLKVIDLETGDQPCFNEDKTVVTFLNGEIYNYQELRSNLSSRGHQLTTKSDTEVLAHLYEEKRDLSFLDQVNGMFCFTIYDKILDKVFVVRDRTGEKPLYYFQNSQGIAFASELSALKTLDGFSAEIDSQAVYLYFRYGYIPAPYSIYKSVRKLEPGTFLEISNQQVKKRRYWELPLPHARYDLDSSQIFEQFSGLLEDSVKIRMIADVPLGAFLSGGIDSSTVVALMRKIAPTQSVQTFTIGFEDSSYDESFSSASMARRLGTNHCARKMSSMNLEEIPKILARFAEPYADSSAIPTYYLCQEARKHITVALSGDGADEILGGYNRYVAGQYATAFLEIPRPLRPRYLLKLAESLPDSHAYYGRSSLKKIKLFARFLSEIYEDEDFIAPVQFDTRNLQKVLSDEFLDQLQSTSNSNPVLEATRKLREFDLTTRMLWTDFVSYMPDDIHVKVDRMSMAHALEVRTPFMDHRLIEFLSTVPLSQKLKGNHTKILLHRLLDQLLGEKYIKSKHGFAAPVAEWMCGSLGKDLLNQLEHPVAKQYLDRKSIAGMLELHKAGRADYSNELWGIYSFLEWLRNEK